MKNADEFRARLGPTAGDRIRVADLRPVAGRRGRPPGARRRAVVGLRQDDQAARGAVRRGRPSELDTILIGAVIVDPVLGVVKADIGIKDGWIVGIGAAGNPAISDGIDLAIGPHTEPIICYGLVATPGAVDSHVHLITPELIPAALAGRRDHAHHGRLRGAAVGHGAHRCAPFEDWPINLGLQANARAAADATLDALLDAGAVGFKIHEDYGAYPELIDAVLRYADAHGVERLAAHRRPERGGRARGHGRRDRRPDRARLPRGGRRRRPRTRRAGSRPPRQHHLQARPRRPSRSASTRSPSTCP